MNIYEKALESLSEKDKQTFEEYKMSALKIQHDRESDPSSGIVELMRSLPGAKKAIKRYDRAVGKLMTVPN